MSIKGFFDKMVDFIAGEKYETPEGPPPKSTHCGRTYALVIGISNYITSYIPRLHNAISDSRLVINIYIHTYIGT